MDFAINRSLRVSRIENSDQRGYFRIVDTRDGHVFLDCISWADALYAARVREHSGPTMRTVHEDGHGDD